MPLARLCLWLALALLLAVQGLSLAAQVGAPDWIPYNGYFQNINPVQRLCAGQWPGRDFDSYLGLGIPWIAWPAARLSGCSPAAIDAAYHLVARLALVLLAAAAAWSAGLRGRASLALFGLAFLAQADLGGILPLLGVPSPPLLTPAVSLFGIRVFLPLLLVVAAAALLPRLPAPAAWALGGAAAAAAALLAPDSGATALAGIAAALIALHGARHGLAPVRFAAGTAAAAGACVLVLALGALLLTGGAPGAWLRWLIGDFLPAQGWLYSYDPEAAAGSWTAPLAHPGTILLAVLAVLAARLPGAAVPAVAGLAVGALAAGWIPYIGGMQNERYLAAIDLVAVLLAAAIAVRSVSAGVARAAAAGLLAMAVASAVLLVPGTLARLQGGPDHGPTPWGGAASRAWTPLWEIAERIRAEGGPLVSLYRGPLDLAVGTPHARRQDFLIHAFSSEAREAWRRDVAAAAWVVTLSPDHAFLGRWKERVFWDVMRIIYLRHAPVADVAPLRVWRARPTPLTPDGRPAACAIDADGALRIRSEDATVPYLAEVVVEIPPARAPMAAESSPAVPAMTVAGTYGLDPALRRHRIVVELAPGETTTVRILDRARPVVPTACAATLFLPRAEIVPPRAAAEETAYLARETRRPHRNPDLQIRISLRTTDPSDPLPSPGDRLDACPDNPIRFVQWHRAGIANVVLAEQTPCLGSDAPRTVRLLPPKDPR